jgi:hypothetical protein
MGVRLYASRKTKAECMVNTWHCCLMLGRWYARFRFMGAEVGAEFH